jgi:predicted transcriptional regulator
MPENPTLSLLVRDLMTVGVSTCEPDTPVKTIARLLIESNVDEIVVLEEGHNIGIVGYEEIIKAYILGDWENLTAEVILRSGITTIPADVPVTAAAQLMKDKNIRALYITHHAGGVEYPAAYISYRHLLRHFAAKDAQELADLGIGAQRKSPIETFIQRRDAARKNAAKR